MGKKKIQQVIIAGVVVIASYYLWPVLFFSKTFFSDPNKPYHEDNPKGYVNDASRLDNIKIDSVINIATDSAVAVHQLINLIKYAVSTGKKISIAGARHSMGGHTIYPGGIQINMLPFNRMHLDSVRRILYVQSGARWAEIIPYLNAKGYSVTVMQSNNSFSVGGSVSVNCHGWQNNSGPVASTVMGFDIIRPDGNVVHCSRNQNKELFSLALGGYGLFGVILNIELRVVPNKEYKMIRYIISSDDYVNEYASHVDGHKEVEMAYGRLDITPKNFLKEAILNTFIADTTVKGLLPLTDPGLIKIRRSIFRGSVGSDYGKEMRWKAEKRLGEFAAGASFTRNELLNEGVEVYEDRDTSTTDILHEYFIPRNNVSAFIHVLQKVIPGHHVDLLNITLRNVEKDTDVFLRYANEEVFGFVMLFHYDKTKDADAWMEKLTQNIIDSALKLNGTYYIPYRLHATKKQFDKAYPMAHNFFCLKKQYDTNSLFGNMFYLKYKDE